MKCCAFSPVKTRDVSRIECNLMAGTIFAGGVGAGHLTLPAHHRSAPRYSAPKISPFFTGSEIYWPTSAFGS